MKNMFKLAAHFEVDGKNIGNDSPCYIIAEAGSNHNRNLKIAFELIDVAAEACADAVKFQTFSAETIVSKWDSELTRIDFAGEKKMFDLYKKIELPRSWQKTLFDYATEKQITFLSTPFDENAVDELYHIGVSAYKIASFEINHFPLLKHVAKTGKPVLISTGMASLGEIEEAIVVLNDAGCDQIALFHCGISYPMDPKEVNLKAMDTMRHAYRCPVGYSDHTLGIEVSLAAVARRAKLIEKHCTLDRGLPGPDHGFALEPGELSAMVSGIRTVESALGNGEKGPTPSELVHKMRGCRSLHATITISKETIFTQDMIAVLRPGAGLHPKYLEAVLGMRAARHIDPDEPLTWDCLKA